MDNTESSPLTPQKKSPWQKETNKHKPQLSLIETENKFELMETESQSPLKQRNPKYPNSLKIRLKRVETFKISDSSQIKTQNTKTKTTPKQNKHQTYKD